MIVFVCLVSAFAVLMVYAGLQISRVFPKRKVVKSSQNNSISDPRGDNYGPLPATVNANERMSGGSEIVGGIDADLHQYDKYNIELKQAAINAGWEPDTLDLLNPTLRGRDILFDTGDEYIPEDPQKLDKKVMTREVTLFNL